MNYGPFFIVAAAMLWAADGLIRVSLGPLPSSVIVFWEHIIGLIVLIPFIPSAVGVLKKFSYREWYLAISVTLVSSVSGTLLFTQALQSSAASGDFLTPLLIQKIQPLIVIFLSVLILKERLPLTYLALAPVALIGSYLMTFGFRVMDLSLSGKELTFLLSFGAAVSWGSGTILSKYLLRKVSYPQFTTIRFLMAIPLSLIISLILGQWVDPQAITITQYAKFALIALSTGAVALLIYYRGLTNTNASVATVCELMFPLASILIAITPLNPYGLPQQLNMGNIIGIALLIVSVFIISMDYIKKNSIRIYHGVVVKGSGNGNKIGYPTANLKTYETVKLDYGVYACKIRLDAKDYEGIMHYGPRAVYGENDPKFEIHFFNFKKNIYGKKLTISVMDYIRTTRFFTSGELLREQITRDLLIARRILRNKV